ncbi:MAG: Putative xylulose kinase, partial [uncultured Gemmatimonadaceae bacterium]
MLLGIDVGTGSSKALLLGPDGAVAVEAASPHPVSAARPGWAETDPEAWWASVVAAVRSAVGDRGDAVEAIGLSGQMHGVVLAGHDGGALRPAILWADGRSAGQLVAYARLPGELAAVLGNPVVAGMAGPTLLWLREHEPEAYARASWALQPKDWLRARLTGTVETDPSDASGTLLYDVEADGWSGAIAEALGLRRDLLAPVREAAEPAGGLLATAGAALGLPAGIPVAVGAADTAAGGLGTGLLGTGEA